jgi:predicted RecB family nuclease
VDDPEAELAVARRCFDWIRDSYPDAVVFHYAPVEKTHARRILDDDLSRYDGTAAAPDGWVDLHPPTKACLDSRAGFGLKVVATEAAGFHWRDESPGGLNSQDWLDQARAGDVDAWQRILDYNEDDVRATLAVRRFLRSVAG